MKQISAAKAIPGIALLILVSLTVACGAGGLVSSPAAPQVSVQSTANPLVAQFTITSVCPGQAMVEFGPDTSYGRNTGWSSISSLYSSNGAAAPTTILVAGMRASTIYHMRSQVQCSADLFTSQDFTFTTGALPTNSFTLPALTVSRPNVSSAAPENPGIEIVTAVNGGAPAFFTDRDANPIWYYDVGQGNSPYVFKLLPNGHIDIVITLANTNTILREIDLAGNTIREMDIPTLDNKMQAKGYDFLPEAYHHDLLPLDNGHVIILTNFTRNLENLTGYPGTTGVVGDGLIDLDPDWNPVWAWNAFDHLDVNRHLNGLPDWTHSNAIVYSPEDGNLLLSMRHQSWVLKIDYNNGSGPADVIWRLGYQGDFALTNAEIPTDDPSQWFSFQHFPSLISQNGPQTTLAVWDNGDNRVLDTSGDTCGAAPSYTPCFSRATTFQVDESAMVANLLWADPLQYFGLWGGSINQLGNGNIEFDLNAPLVAPGPNVLSQVQEVNQTPGGQVVWQMQITQANAYRAYRVPSLYPGVTWQY
jgi:arylsulfate sulfotransferase